MTAITLRLDDLTYERLRTEAFHKRTTITALIRESVAQHVKIPGLTLRANPETPPDQMLEVLASLAIMEHWNGNSVAVENANQSEVDAIGYRSVWRHGCDAGMVAK